MKETALSIYEEYKDWDEVDIDYKVGFTGFNLIGIIINTTIYNEGAAHPHSLAKAMLIDLTTAELIGLRHLFKSDYKADLDRILLTKLEQTNTSAPCQEWSPTNKEEQNAKRMIVNIFGEEAEGCFSGFKDGWTFYLKDSSVVFVFPKYSVASGASGIVEVGVNFKELRGLLNPNGPIVEAMLAQSPEPEPMPTSRPGLNPQNIQSALPEKQWWSARNYSDECHESKGPAAMLDIFVGSTERPTTQDYHDSSGKLYKVEVINIVGSTRTWWTYYKNKALCEAEQVNATKSLADKYR